MDGAELQLDVWRPTSSNGAAVVYIHGGGFVSGSRHDVAPYAPWLTSRGYTVFSADYRLAGTGQPTWDKAPGDVLCALGWVHGNAPVYGSRLKSWR